VTRLIAIGGAAGIALTAGHFGLLAVAPLAIILWWRALDHVGRRQGETGK
jgi:hypothetical protein